ncbi:hypothetical protein BDV36DRAFT_295239 [Aspergillus pseudocaelatus]|uniref:Uncharacterized protein n=1 Tax=Aspergillus pseudocaelatus TaxID=1825620 RepID=A0ABQ6WP50_9EURO|nr:hypothetical protein BDV36DRAFT_295239 [Aspergillus pseudocaelatus]
MAFFGEGPVVFHPGHGLVQTVGVNNRNGRRPQDTGSGNRRRGKRPTEVSEINQRSRPSPASGPSGYRGGNNRPANGNNNRIQKQGPRQPQGLGQKQKFTSRRSRRGLGPQGKGPRHGGANNAPRHPGQRRGPQPRVSRDGDTIMRDVPALNRRPVRQPGISVRHPCPRRDVVMVDVFTTAPPSEVEDVVMLDVFTTPHPVEEQFAALAIAAPQFATGTGEEPQDIEMFDAPPLYFY